MARNPRAAERKQVAQLLGLWNTRLLCAIAGGGVRRFSSLSQEEREQVLLSWADSRVVQRRAAFQALRKGTLLAYYGQGGANGARNPAWDAIGYPGPARPAAESSAAHDRAARRSPRTRAGVRRRRGRLGRRRRHRRGRARRAGLDVVIVEAGPYFSERDFDGAELSGFERLYLNGGGMASADASVGLLAAQALGGTTLVNYTFSFRTPDGVRREWADEHGVQGVAERRLRRQPRRRLGADRRQRGAQHPEPPRRDDPKPASTSSTGNGT